MLATARLTGQTTGAALVALLLHLNGGQATRAGLFVAAAFALAGMIISVVRIRLPLPEGLHKR
jgi:DHA2 family multidrug resistance protein-like MFS transporter